MVPDTLKFAGVAVPNRADTCVAAVAVLLILFTTLLLMADRALRRRSEG